MFSGDHLGLYLDYFVDEASVLSMFDYTARDQRENHLLEDAHEDRGLLVSTRNPHHNSIRRGMSERDGL